MPGPGAVITAGSQNQRVRWVPAALTQCGGRSNSRKCLETACGTYGFPCRQTPDSTNKQPGARLRLCHEKPLVSSGFVEAAGQGFEPQLPGPEPGVLPLDDPATAGGVYRVLGGLPVADLETIDRNEALLGLCVDARDDLDVGLEPGSTELRLEEPIDLVDP
jgi:hypothetical protein